MKTIILSIILSLVSLQAFSNDCTVVVGDYKFNTKFLLPLLTTQNCKVLSIKNEDLAKNLVPGRLVLQTRYDHQMAFYTPFTAFHDCTVFYTLHEVVQVDGLNLLKSVMNTARANLKRMVGSKKKACGEAASRGLDAFEALDSYHDHTNRIRMLFDTPSTNLLNEEYPLHWNSWSS